MTKLTEAEYKDSNRARVYADAQEIYDDSTLSSMISQEKFEELREERLNNEWHRYKEYGDRIPPPVNNFEKHIDFLDSLTEDNKDEQT